MTEQTELLLPSTAPYRKALSRLPESQKDVLDILRTIGRVSDEELVERYMLYTELGHVIVQTESGIRSRRAELVKQGFVRKDGTTKNARGNAATLWKAIA